MADPFLEPDPTLVLLITPHNTSFISLTIGHEEFGDQVNVPVSAPAHRLRGPLQQLKTLIQLQAGEREREAPQGPPSPAPAHLPGTPGELPWHPMREVNRGWAQAQQPHLLQGCDGGALTPIVGVPVHMQHFLAVHGHDARQDTFLGKRATFAALPPAHIPTSSPDLFPTLNLKGEQM